MVWAGAEPQGPRAFGGEAGGLGLVDAVRG